MTDITPVLTTIELVEIVRRFIALKPRFRMVIPDHIAVIRSHLVNLYPSGSKVSSGDHDLLYNIGVILARQQEPMMMSELSRALNVPLSSATRIVDWLVRGGYAERLPDPDDRRIVRVTLTEAGLEMYRISNDYIQQRVEGLLQNFTSDERENLVVLLGRLVDTLEEELKELPDEIS